MKTILCTLVFAFSMTAHSHIEKGTWRGDVSANAFCFMEVGDTTFINNIKNPLNERIAIQIGQTQYSVKHPHSVDFVSGTISFNHDVFEDVVPTATGAYALQIKMSHNSQGSAPESLSVMEHDWKSGFKEVVACKNLIKVD